MIRIADCMGQVWLPLLVVLAACTAPRQPGGDAAVPSLAGTSWQLSELNGRPPVPVPETGAPTLEFAADGSRATGNGGCNRFGGPYTQAGTSLRFGPLAATRRACVDEAANRQETDYFQALQSVTRFSMSNGDLLLYAGDRAVARFRPAGG